jgi:two-component system NtrC family sensor kinase
VNCEGDATLVQWRQRPALQVNLMDVSERKKVGEQLRRAEKLSALGQLIAGVAHELNNPLAVVIGYSQILAEKSGLDKETIEDIHRIHHESERASRIVRDLLSFSRPSEPQKKAVNINRLVASMLETQEANLQAAGIQLDQQLANDLSTTIADPNQIEQVLVNLVGNAIQVLSGRPSPSVLTVRTEEAGNYIRMIVADNGPGIPREIIGQIFDPFFTTKPLGKGTGLGLTISNTIIQEHHGRIQVENQPAGGAKFTVELPVVQCVVTPTVDRLPPEIKPAVVESHKRAVLVVDDEPNVLALLKKVMTQNGYEVVTAANGQQALERIAARSYDVILSDMRMPGMDGRKFFEIVRKQDAALADRIVFVTGDTVSPDTQEFFEATGNRWLSKPFSIAQVTATVNEVLETEVVSV